MPKVGYRFRPTEQELLGYFLFNKITGNPVLDEDEDDPVKMCDMYGSDEPWEIWNSYGGNKLLEDEALYFFTPLKKLSPKSSRYNRKIGLGTWQGEDAPKSVVDVESNRILGFKKRFRYENPNNSQQNGGWIVYEYTLDSGLLEDQCLHKATDYVLCRMKKNESVQQKGKKQRGSKKIDEKTEIVKGVSGKKRKVKQGAMPSNEDQNKRLKVEAAAAILMQPRELPILEVVESEGKVESSSSLTFDVEDLLVKLVAIEEVDSRQSRINVHECDLQTLRAEDGEEVVQGVDCEEKKKPWAEDGEVMQGVECEEKQQQWAEEVAQGVGVECEAQKDPVLEDEGFFSNEMDQILERFFANVGMEMLGQGAL